MENKDWDFLGMPENPMFDNSENKRTELKKIHS